jgi:hypothetical protein
MFFKEGSRSLCIWCLAGGTSLSMLGGNEDGLQLEPLNDFLLGSGNGDREPPLDLVLCIAQLGRDLVRGFSLASRLADGPGGDGCPPIGPLSLCPSDTGVGGAKVDAHDDLAIGDGELVKLHGWGATYARAVMRTMKMDQEKKKKEAPHEDGDEAEE